MPVSGIVYITRKFALLHMDTMIITDPAEICKAAFEKEFELNYHPKTLPPVESWFPDHNDASPFCDSRFKTLHEELNRVKGQLNNLPLKDWHQHTKYQNPAGDVVPRVRTITRPDLLTQAWCKFTECLNRYHLAESLIDKEKSLLKSAHLCEAPGAFISALHYHLQCLNLQLDWKWKASTLNPYYEGNSTSSMINDDRFIMHTMENWTFGIDKTGDILELQNRASMVEEFGRVHLVTADGSIDCQGDPANQEQIVAPLHMAEVAVALNILQKDGHFVLKMFTCFEIGSLCLLYLLCHSFEQVSMFKPVTSKEGNSEVYIICQRFKNNLNSQELQKLLNNCLKTTPMFLAKGLPDTYIDIVVQAATFFKDIQCSVIEKNLVTFKDRNILSRETLRTLRHSVVEKYIQRNSIVKIETKLVQYPMARVQNCLNLDDRVEVGTFEDRLKRESMKKTINFLRSYFESIRVDWIKFRKVEWIYSYSVSYELDLEFGKPFDAIQSSKFCPSKMLHNYREVCLLCETNPTSPHTSLQRPKRQKMHMDDQPESLYWPQISSIFHEVQKSVTSLNMEGHNVLSPENDLLKRKIRETMDILNSLHQGHHLVLLNFICLTRMQCAFLQILSNSFEAIGFARPIEHETAIFLSGFKGDTSETLKLFQEILEAMEKIEKEKDDMQLLRVLPMSYSVQGKFYPLLVAFNVLAVRSKALIYLSDTKIHIQV